MLEQIEQDLHAIIVEVLQTVGCVLWGTEFVAHGKTGLLRIYIDKQGDEEVSIDDCASVSQQLDLVLAVKIPNPRSYTLEVSSPGLDRRFFSLEQIVPYQGQVIKCNLLSAIGGRKRFKGIVREVHLDRDLVLLEVEKEVVEIPFSAVRTARLEMDYRL